MTLNYKNILFFDFFIFDLDGTILDTEPIHYKAWYNTINTYTNNNINEFTLYEYYKNFHSYDKNSITNYLQNKFNIKDEKIFEKKNKLYQNYIKHENIKSFKYVEEFINYLIKNNKIICVVTNTSYENISILKQKFKFLEDLEIYTKEMFTNKKPHPECYYTIVKKYPNLKYIGFEDSMTGFHALYQVVQIMPVLIHNNNYYWNTYMDKFYTRKITIDSFNINNINNLLNEYLLR